MKSKIFNIFFLFSLLFLIKSKEPINIEIISSDSKYLLNEYTSLFQIPITHIKHLYSNGGERANHELSKAFDNDWNTQWFSEGQQGENYTNTKTNITYNFLKNFIIITFDTEIYLDKMIYKTDNCNGCEGIGYPKTLNIYSKVDSTEDYYSEDNFDLIGTITSEATKEIVLFNFSQTIKCTHIKLEWEDIQTYYPRYEKFTTAKEIQFFIPENEYLNEKILNIFSSDDYRFMTLNPEFNDSNVINNIIKNNEHILKFHDGLKYYLNRAKLASTGALKFDWKREFTTDQSKEKNVIRQRGDIQSYTRNILKMAMAGTNRQSLGIFTLANETINIFVYGEENDSLPKIRFSQYIGNTGFLGNEISLVRGRQSLTCNNFKVDNFDIKVISGGPLYLSNPYTSKEQGQNVKIYIEGGKLFPRFMLEENESEDEYKYFLEEYLKIYENNKDKYFDMTELVGIRTMITVPASLAFSIYKDKSKGPIENLQNWDEYIKQLYTFDGIEYKTSEPHYDIRNIYTNLHIRYSQPYGAAYASGEHIGIFNEDWLKGAIYGKVFGWGFAHEIGHMMDINERTVIENSNNMISKFDESYIRKEGTRGEYARSLLYLTPDDISVAERGCEINNNTNCKGFFTNLQMNFMIWWYIESLFPGYWGKLDNIYRYDYDIGNKTMSRTERFIFFSNVVTEIDLGYYFNRWGFFLNNEGIFYPEEASDSYKNKMNEYIEKGIIKENITLKFWYLDYKEYMYRINGGEGCYVDKNIYDVEINKVFYINKYKTIILLPDIKCEGHLGFEIYEHDKLIGFTYDNYYVDLNEYNEDYEQKYKIIAYDRELNPSKESDYKTKEVKESVCICNSITYNSIKEAIENSEENEIDIYLLKDTFEGSIEINKKVNIFISEQITNKNITIYKIDSSPLFDIKENGELNITGKDLNNRIILDGMNFPSKGNLIYCSKGIFKGNNLILQNLNNTEDKGGAIYAISSTLNLNNALIYNNYATHGAGLYAQIGSGMKSYLNNVIFEKNKGKTGAGVKNTGEIDLINCEINNCYASEYGGGLANNDGGIAKLNNVKIINNYAGNMGGGLYIDGATTLTSIHISENKADIGAGIAYIGGNNKRILDIKEGTVITNNEASRYAGGLYVKNGIANLNNGEIYKNIINSKDSQINSDMLYIENGVVNINSIKLEGSLYKSNSCKINLKSALIKYNQESKIYIDFPNNGSNITLIEGSGYNIISEDLNKINLIDSNSGNLGLSTEKNSILFAPQILQISFKKSNLKNLYSNEGDKLFYYGQIITLSQELFPVNDNEYISKIYDIKKKEYTLGESIKLISNIEFLYDISYKNEIILDFGDYEEKKLLIPTDYLFLPLFRNDYSEDKQVLYWKDIKANEQFNTSEKILGNNNRTLISIYSENYFLLHIYAFNIKYDSKLLKYQETVTLPELIIPEKNHFDGWKDLLGNKKYDKDIKNILIEKDYYLEAVIIGYIKFYISDKLFLEKTADINSTFIILNTPEYNDYNWNIDYWKEKNSNNIFYFDEKYKLKGDLELYAVIKNDSTNSNEDNTSVVLIVVCCFVGVIILLFFIFVVFRYFQKKKERKEMEAKIEFLNLELKENKEQKDEE